MRARTTHGACLAAALAAAVAALCACATGAAEAERADADLHVEGEREVGETAILRLADRELRAFARRRRAADLADAAYSMERGLREMGYAHATVAFAAYPSEDEPLRVVFTVEEGPRAETGSIRFPGATAFPHVRLVEFFEAAPADLLGLEEPPFRLSDIETGAADVERLYLLGGYADVIVGPVRVAWSEDRRRADVEVPVVEGAKYVVSSVRIEGAGDPALEAQLVRELDLAGAPWHARVPAESAARVRRFLLRQGRQAAEAEAKAELDGEAATAAVVVTVRPGPVFRLRDVVVQGNERTRSPFLRGLVDLGPGDLLGQEAIDDAIDRFYTTGVLRSVRHETPRTSDGSADADGVVESDLLLAVEELEARSVEAGIGWGSYEKARGHVEYRDRNLFGLARELSVRPSASVVGFGLETGLTDRYLLGPNDVVRLAAAYHQREEPSFLRRGASGEASVRHEFRKGLYLKGGYLLRAEEAEERDGSIPGAEEEGFVLSAGPFVEAGWDTRDDPLFPQRGSQIEGGLFRSAPAFGADLDFLETRFAAATHVPLRDEGTVLALGFRFTTRSVEDERSTLPIQERLFLGGESTVRSFGEAELGPHRRRDPLGGLTSAVATAELRQQIRGNLWGALFYDVGTVGRDAWDLSGPRGHALGVGLRYRLPVGPIRLDFGWNPGRQFAADRSWAVHLSFGFTF